MPWARTIAASVSRRLRPGTLEWADHVQNASIGLMEAMSRFDAGRGIEFTAFARSRVRGAVFNGIREWYRLDTGRGGDHSVERMESISAGDDGDPLDGFIDTVVGLGVGLLLESSSMSPDLASDSGEQFSIIHDALLDLPERQRDILISHYFMQMQFQEIASKLGVTKGRVSQLHKDAISRLRIGLRVRRYEAECFF